MKKIAFTLLCVFFLLATGCERTTVNPGEVALVNGKPITMKQLQAAHDAMVVSGDNPGRAVESLRREYGAVLAELITQELVMQELEKLDLAVSDAEVAEEEARLLSDFMPGDFERILLEESIDVDLWREGLRRHLSVQKFQNLVLRTQVAITAAEVEAVFRKNSAMFQVPERLHFIQFTSMASEHVLAACEEYRKTRDIAAVQKRFPNLNAKVVAIRQDRLDPQLLKAMSKLKPMEATSPIELGTEFSAVVLLGREAARQLSREEIYQRIETILLEDKMEGVFSAWLAQRVDKSRIFVSTHLVPRKSGEGS